MLADIPVGGAGGGGLGGDVWSGAVGCEYRFDDVVQCVIGLCDK